MRQTPQATKDDIEIREGGYHSRGVPGEEAELRKTMRVLNIRDLQRTVTKTQPIKGGHVAESTSAGRYESELAGDTDLVGKRALYVLARRGDELLQTPVFAAGKDNQQEAVIVFSEEVQAQNYVYEAGWQDDYEPVALSPGDLGEFLREVKQDKISLVAMNPARTKHLQGEPQRVLNLVETPDLSGENLYRELWSMRQPEA
jgi:hypothetical protein